LSDSADLTRTIVLKTGNTFVVSLPEGELPVLGTHPLGLYREDGRFLCGHELRIAGVRPRLLVATAVTGAESVHELTNPDLELPSSRRLALQTLQLRLERRLADEVTMQERIHVHLYGREAVELDLELALAADFQPMFAVRGIVEPSPRAVRLDAVERGLRFSARCPDGVVRATTVSADPAPAAALGGRLRFPLRLQPGGAADVVLRYDLHDERTTPAAPRAARAVPHHRRQADVEWPAGRTRVRADDELFNRVLDRSLLDLRMLRSQLDGQAYCAAGIPWFATLFGRDSLITALETLAFDPSLAEQTLRVLAARLGRRVDPRHDEEPGKVLHELRSGEVAALDATPLTRYYGTVDATPLFLCLLAEHADWAGTLELFNELAPAVEAALGWIERYADHDGDGLLDYRAGDPRGLRNQCWKDSGDGVLDEHGAPLEPPIAVVEAQAYAVRALRGLARLHERAGRPERAGALARDAAALQERLERFWLPGRRFYSMALDREGRASAALASNQGHLLWAIDVAPQRAAAVRDALMGEALFSGWGIRTLGRGEAGFNPVGYHLGTVWPHDTALAAAGLRHHGYDDDFVVLFEALLDAASHAGDYRLPELFAGFSRTQFETPVPYPVACHPQAWAAAAIPYLLASGLGLNADGLERSLRIRRPSLPHWVNRVEVDGLRVAGARVDLLFERAGADGRVALTDAHVDGELDVVLEVAGGLRGGSPARGRAVGGRA
jgi:glycogen debranching enzyme